MSEDLEKVSLIYIRLLLKTDQTQLIFCVFRFLTRKICFLYFYDHIHYVKVSENEALSPLNFPVLSDFLRSDENGDQ